MFAVKTTDISSDFRNSWVFQHATDKSDGSSARDLLIFDSTTSQLKNVYCIFTQGSGNFKNITIDYVVRADVLRITEAFSRTILSSRQNEKKPVYATKSHPFITVSLDCILKQDQLFGDTFENHLYERLALEEARFIALQERVNKLAAMH